MAWDDAYARAYYANWVRQKRLALVLAAYARGDRSRKTINYLGRLSCRPREKWCAWGQHRVCKVRFRVSRRNRDGLQDLCRRCQDMASHAARHRQYHAKPSPGGQPAAGTPAVLSRTTDAGVCTAS